LGEIADIGEYDGVWEPCTSGIQGQNPLKLKGYSSYA